MIRKAVANGNWSNTATWDGGTLPGVGDDVYSNTFTVTIDQNITVLSISNMAATGVTAGGSFSITASRTVNANIFGGAAVCVNVTGAGTILTFSGNITGGTAAFAAMNLAMTGATASAIITGNLLGGTGTGSYALTSSLATLTQLVTINGNITGGSGATSYGYFIGGIAPVNIIGNITGGSNATATGLFLSTANVLTITGSVYGSTGTGLIINSTGATLILNGSVYGSSLGSSVGVQMVTTSTANITGTVYGGTLGYGLTAGNSTVVDIDTAEATTDLIPAVRCVSTSAVVRVRKMVWSASGQSPVEGRVYFKNVSNIQVFAKKHTGTLTALFDGSAGGGSAPLPQDVRLGVLYDFGAETGTLAVPNPVDVRSGVATDDTLGTGLIDKTDFDANLVIINNGIKNASYLIPHTTDLIP